MTDKTLAKTEHGFGFHHNSAGGLPLVTFVVTALLTVFVTQNARADVAPDPRSVALQQLIPVGHEMKLSRYNQMGVAAGPIADAPVDVSMAAEKVVMDIYPTFAHVQVTFHMKSGQAGEKGLQVGFPETLMSTHIGYEGRMTSQYTSSLPMDGLLVKVNGKSLSPRLESIDRVIWWVWTMDFEPQKNVTIEVSYFQGLEASIENDKHMLYATYILRSGSLWKGPIGKAEIVTTLHGLDPAEARFTWPPDKTEGSRFFWTLTNIEPDRDFIAGVSMKNSEVVASAFGKPPYEFDAASKGFRTNDRITRLNRLITLQKESFDEKTTAKLIGETESIVEELIETASSTNENEKARASEMLFQMDGWVSNTSWDPTHISPAQEACAAWLPDIGKDKARHDLYGREIERLFHSYSHRFIDLKWGFSEVCNNKSEQKRFMKFTLLGCGLLAAIAIIVTLVIRRRRILPISILATVLIAGAIVACEPPNQKRQDETATVVRNEAEKRPLYANGETKP